MSTTSRASAHSTTTMKKTSVSPKAAAKKKATVTKLTKKAVTSRKQPTVTQTSTNMKGAILSETIQALRSSNTDLSHLMDIEPYQPKTGEEYMNTQQQEHFITILQSWKASLMQEVDRTVTHMKDEAANFPDITDRATQEEEFNLELRTRDRERKLIKKIDEALQRIQEQEFGYCDACGVEIGIRRLEARPTATLCIDCKTLAEIKEKQTFS